MLRNLIITLVVLVLGTIVILVVNTQLTTQTLPVTAPAAEPIILDQDAAVKRLAQAVRYQTVSHGPDVPVSAQAFDDLHDFLVQNYPRVHETLERERIGGHSLLYMWKGRDPDLKSVLLSAHLDVVPVEPDTEKEWEYPPFAGDIAEGFVWGRGTLDDKGSVLGILEAVEFLLGQGFTPTRTIYLAFGHDEELGGQNGAAMIAERLAERGERVAFILDEGSAIVQGIVPGIEKPVALIGLAEKGYLTLEILVQGQGGHTSMPGQDTVIGRLARALQRIHTQPMPGALRPPASELFETLAAQVPWTWRIVLANRWLFDPLILDRLALTPATNAMIRTTCVPTLIAGGVKENVLPSQATATVNCRLLPGDTVAEVTAHLREVIGDPAVTVTPSGAVRESSPVADSKSESFTMLRKGVQEVFPEVVVAPSLVLAGTDSKWYTGIADNIYRFLPIRLEQADLKRIHGTNERIDVSNYREIIRFYVQLLRNTAE